MPPKKHLLTTSCSSLALTSPLHRGWDSAGPDGCERWQRQLDEGCASCRSYLDAPGTPLPVRLQIGFSDKFQHSNSADSETRCTASSSARGAQAVPEPGVTPGLERACQCRCLGPLASGCQWAASGGKGGRAPCSGHKAAGPVHVQQTLWAHICKSKKSPFFSKKPNSIIRGRSERFEALRRALDHLPGLLVRPHENHLFQQRSCC